MTFIIDSVNSQTFSFFSQNSDDSPYNMYKRDTQVSTSRITPQDMCRKYAFASHAKICAGSMHYHISLFNVFSCRILQWLELE